MFTLKTPSFWRRTATALALVAALSACSERGVEWSLYNVRWHLPDLEFALKGEGNKQITEADLAGKTVLLFFGYASCPDVCPTTMAQLTEVMQQLGDDAKEVRIAFVSVDPHRDTPDALQAYVNAFNPNAIGMTGTEREIARLAKRYRVAYQIETPPPDARPGQYDVTHSRGVYIFDNQGRARLLASDTESTAVLTQDIKQLIALTRDDA